MCVHLIGRICRPLSRHYCIISHYSLIHLLAASLSPSLSLTLLLFCSSSLPLSLAFTCLLVSGEITTAQKRCPTALQRSALLCLPPPIQHTHMDSQMHTHILQTYTLTHTHAHTYTKGLYYPFPTHSFAPLPATAYTVSSGYCAPPLMYYVPYRHAAVYGRLEVLWLPSSALHLCVGNSMYLGAFMSSICNSNYTHVCMYACG